MLVPFDSQLSPATLIRRYKRFLADVELPDGRRLTVHCPNSGSMASCSEPGRPVMLRDSADPRRKLRHSWELIRMGRTWVGVHSVRSNFLLARFIGAGALPELAAYDELQRERPYGPGARSRIDLLLSARHRPPCYVEVKHSTMRVGRHAAFPDAPTERGRKHLEDLLSVVRTGGRAVIFFVVGRGDCSRFRPADEVDPAYGRALRRALRGGVELLAYRVGFSPAGARLGGRLPVDL